MTTRWARRFWPALLALAVAGCGGSRIAPAALAAGEACAYCRMTISDRHLAAQLVAPGEEPKFFDDIGCLAGFVKERQDGPAGEVAFVADHRTGEWVSADSAVFTRAEAVATPMASHLIAHRDAASRDADRDAAHGTPVSVRDVLGPWSGGGGSR